MQNINKNSFVINFPIFIGILVILSFFYGFYTGENSAGAGGYSGDFQHVWNNLNIFKKNSFIDSLLITSGKHLEYTYHSSRPPLLYALNSFLNPYVDEKESYILSIFVFSIFTYLFFLLALKLKYEKILDKSLIFLLSTILLLSPYFRTSAFWGLEENFGIFFLILSFIFYSRIENINYKMKNYFNIFFITFFSSMCVYFDQKLLIIPIICFLEILKNKKFNYKHKIFMTILYFLFSLPFIYLIKLWGNIIPSIDASSRKTLQNFFLGNIGYSVSIIAFYILPFLFFKKENFFLLIKNKISNKKIIYFILFFLLYIIFIFKFDNINQDIIGNGIIYKLSIILFDNFNSSKYFLYFSFFISWLIVLIFIDDKKDFLIIVYFLFTTIFIFPVFQEYYDPLIILLILFFFNTKLYFNFKNVSFLFIYLITFFVIANFKYNYNFF